MIIERYHKAGKRLFSYHGSTIMHTLFTLPALALLLAPEGAGGGGASTKPILFAARVSALQATQGNAAVSDKQKLGLAENYIEEVEQRAAGWESERAQLIAERDRLIAGGPAPAVVQTGFPTFEERMVALKGAGKAPSMDQRLTAAESYIAEVETRMTGLIQERDYAVALSKNPSQQAAAILAMCGGPAMPMRAASNLGEMQGGKPAAAPAAGKTGLAAAMAKVRKP